MRQLASFLLIALVLPATAAEIWRWKDADGSWHFSDNPTPGAERVTVNPPTRSGSSAPPRAPTYSSSSALVLPQEIVQYTRCVVAAPVNDAVFQWTDSVPATVIIDPTLQPGHRIEVLLNGSPYPQWSPDLRSYSFTGLFRGSYSLAVRVTDGKGAVLCNGPAITFHVRQPSVLSPVRKPAAKH